MFGGAYSATVKGATAEQANKIKTALNDAYTAASIPALKVPFTNVFQEYRNVTIIVENTTVYANYKTTDDGKTLYLNLACVNGSDLQTKLTAAVTAMNTPTAETATHGD